MKSQEGGGGRRRPLDGRSDDQTELRSGPGRVRSPLLRGRQRALQSQEDEAGNPRFRNCSCSQLYKILFALFLFFFLVNDFQCLVEEQNCYRPLSGRGRRPGGRRPGRRFPGRPRRPRPVYYDYYYDYEDYDDYYYDYDNYYEDDKFTSPARPQTSADAVKSLVEDSNSGDNQQLLLIVIQDSDIPSQS